jgi:DNA-directed RNA polymerase II subunit RPB1
LYHELKAVLSFDGTYINDRHLMLAVHAITHEGFLMPMTRHGINRQGKIGFLARSSFEETVDVFCQAAAFAESDNMDGVTQNIMFGQTTPLGTGVFHILSEKKPEAKNKHKITNPWESMLTRKRSRPVDE